MALRMESALTAESVLAALTQVTVPGFGVNPVDLGLIYGVEVEGTDVRLVMTLPDIAPEVPVNFRLAIEQVVRGRHPDLGQIAFDLVWDPPWREGTVAHDRLIPTIASLPGRSPGVVSAAAIRASLHRVIDPDWGINVVDLGLVRDIQVAGLSVTVTMTLTSADCRLRDNAEAVIRRVLITCHASLAEVSVELVWQPRWSESDISPEGKAALVAQASS